ncbi:MAG TPA: FecR domain-containing protein [Polyangiaceae bacterium]|jgi:hypothetical protein|nr:FecR domain-containing protein [Polyangiaceae bacterium]
MSDRLDKLVREARNELGAREAHDVDWDSVDAALFDRIAKERRAERLSSSSFRLRAWHFAAVAFAGAAIVAVALGRQQGPTPVAGTRAGQDESAGAIIAVDREGDGEGFVLVNGAPASRGAVVRLGDVIEPRGVSVTVERPGKLTIILEHESRAKFHVEHSSAEAPPAGGMLVLTLERGAVEARVVPVVSGQAFAVDVEDSRVAVHGTHFRVARTMGRVAVDLSEGVVSIGQLGGGSMPATLVTAPAHAEFVTNNVPATLTVTHEPSALRAPVAIPSAAPIAAAPRPQAQRARTEAPPNRAASGEAGADRPEMHTDPAVPSPAAPRSDADVEVDLANAVRACMAERPHAENVTVIVRTVLVLDLSADGSVRGARFEPPVALDVNECATKSIYKTHLAHGGTAAIPIDFTN